MPLTVQYQDEGVCISNADKNIHLSTDAWEHLIRLRKDIDHALKNPSEISWKIDEQNNIQVQINNFQDKWYFHIRKFWKSGPTKTGIAVLASEWKEFKTHLKPSAESKLGLEVYTAMVGERVGELVRAACDGCQQEWSSQLNHACIMDARTTAEQQMNAAVMKVTALDFILELAKKAHEKKVILEKPHQTFKRIVQFHLKEVKDGIVFTLEDF